MTDRTQSLDFARERPIALLRRPNVPPDLTERDLERVEETEGESKDDFLESSLRLCDGTGK